MRSSTPRRLILSTIALLFGLLPFAAQADPPCGKARTEVSRLDCGERISLVVNKVCATTTIRGKKTQMVGVEVVAQHPGVSGAAVVLYEKGALGTSVKRLIKEKGKGKKPGEPFVIHDQSYNKEGPGGFKKIWAVTNDAGDSIEKLLLKIQLNKGGEVCKKEIPIQQLWGTVWWDDGDSERDSF